MENRDRIFTKVLGVDEGEVFPIAATSIDLENGEKQCMLVKRNELNGNKNFPRNQIIQKNQIIMNAQLQLGRSASKYTYRYDKFYTGYFMDFLKHEQELLSEYSKVQFRELRFAERQQQSKLFDVLTNRLFSMIKVTKNKYKENIEIAKNDNKEKIVVLGVHQPKYNRNGAAASKHSTFWDFFIRKVVAILKFRQIPME